MKISHTFGSDPEAFIYSDFFEANNGIYIPEIIPPAALAEDFGFEFHQKDDKKVLLESEDYQWSEDGAAIEMQVSPSNDIYTLFRRITGGRSALERFLRNSGKFDRTVSVGYKVVGHFDIDKYWKNRDESFRQCVIFGCDPDQFPRKYFELGLEKEGGAVEIDASNHMFRYGGGHLHMQSLQSNPELFFDHWQTMAILLDIFVGLAGTTIPKDDVSEKMRKKYYGRPGRVRLQVYDEDNEKYGIEYRPLSNSWTKSTKDFRKLIYNMDLVGKIVESNLHEDIVKLFDDKITHVYNAIINIDYKSAFELYNQAIEYLLSIKFISLDDLLNLAGQTEDD